MALPTQSTANKTGSTNIAYEDSSGLFFTKIGGIRRYTGSGSPNGEVTAPKGSEFIDDDTPAIWQNTDGGTTWEKVGTQS